MFPRDVNQCSLQMLSSVVSPDVNECSLQMLTSVLCGTTAARWAVRTCPVPTPAPVLRDTPSWRTASPATVQPYHALPYPTLLFYPTTLPYLTLPYYTTLPYYPTLPPCPALPYYPTLLTSPTLPYFPTLPYPVCLSVCFLPYPTLTHPILLPCPTALPHPTPPFSIADISMNIIYVVYVVLCFLRGEDVCWGAKGVWSGLPGYGGGADVCLS